MEWHSKHQRELASDIGLLEIDPTYYVDVLDVLFPSLPLITASPNLPQHGAPPKVDKPRRPAPIPASRLVEMQVGYIDRNPLTEQTAFFIGTPRRYASRHSLPCAACGKWRDEGWLLEHDNGAGCAHTFTPHCAEHAPLHLASSAPPLIVELRGENTYEVYVQSYEQT